MKSVNNTELEQREGIFDTDEDEKECMNILSPHNPFEALQETGSVKEKVIHLSTINTDENFEPK
jgi:hypothetical protein